MVKEIKRIKKNKNQLPLYFVLCNIEYIVLYIFWYRPSVFCCRDQSKFICWHIFLDNKKDIIKTKCVFVPLTHSCPICLPLYCILL